MEKVKIKDGLKTAMNVSHLCNVYFQENKPWDLHKQGNIERCHQVVNVAMNTLFLLCKMLEPFIPSFSAKVYEQMDIKDSDRDQKLFEFLFEGSKIAETVEGKEKVNKLDVEKFA
jgi:methionyl-tRNA synthetase